MEYVTLQRFSYQPGVDPQQVSDEVERRQQSPASVQLRFDDQRYFYLLIPEVAKLSEAIHEGERAIGNLIATLPPRAAAAGLSALFIREVMATHEIEGIHSSRREVEEVLKASKPSQHKRFAEFTSVLKECVINRGAFSIEHVEDIRSLYDRVTKGEVSAEDALDGELFRKSPVYVRSESQKILHTGFQPEKEIRRGLQDMLNETKQPSTTKLIAAILGHFMFETIHPFYDGNGRTGRVLLGYHLRDILGSSSILSLSQAISESKRAYYNALKDARDPRNHGELTHFIIAMMTFIRSAQDTLIRDLKQSSERLQHLQKNLNALEFDALPRGYKPRVLTAILLEIGQAYAFGSELGLTLNELRENEDLRDIGRRTLPSYCEELVNRGFLKTTRKRPLTYTLTSEAAQQFDLD